MNIPLLLVSVLLIIIISVSVASSAKALQDANKVKSSAIVIDSDLTINKHYGINSKTILKNTLSQSDDFFNNFHLQRGEFESLFKKVFNVPTVFLPFSSANPVFPSSDFQLFNLKKYIDTKSNIFESVEAFDESSKTPTPTQPLPPISENMSQQGRFEAILTYMIPDDKSIVTIENIYLVPLDNTLSIGGKANRNLYIANIVIGSLGLVALLVTLYKSVTSGGVSYYDAY